MDVEDKRKPVAFPTYYSYLEYFFVLQNPPYIANSADLGFNDEVLDTSDHRRFVLPSPGLTTIDRDSSAIPWCRCQLLQCSSYIGLKMQQLPRILEGDISEALDGTGEKRKNCSLRHRSRLRENDSNRLGLSGTIEAYHTILILCLNFWRVERCPKLEP